MPPKAVNSENYVDLIEKTLEVYATLSHLRVIEAKTRYLLIIQKNPLYGSAFFPLKYKGFWSYSENILLTVGAKYISFIHPRTRESFMIHPIQSISSYEVDANGETLSIGLMEEDPEDNDRKSLVIYKFTGERTDEIVLLLREYRPLEQLKEKEKVPEISQSILAADIIKARQLLLLNRIVKIPGPSAERMPNLKKVLNSISQIDLRLKSTPSLNARKSSRFKSKKSISQPSSDSPESYVDSAFKTAVQTPSENFIKSNSPMGSPLKGMADIESNSFTPENYVEAPSEIPVKETQDTTTTASDSVIPEIVLNPWANEVKDPLPGLSAAIENPAGDSRPSIIIQGNTGIPPSTLPESRLSSILAPPIRAPEEYTLADWQSSKKRILESLLNTLNDELDAWSVQFSALILAFVPDPMIAFSQLTMIDESIQKCLDDEEYALESFLQLIKYTTDHPEPDSSAVINIWKLMCIWCCCVKIKGDVATYLKAHLRAYSYPDPRKTPRWEEAKYAQFANKILTKTLISLPRKLGPSLVEIKAITQCSNMLIRVFVLDGQFRSAYVDSNTTIRELSQVLKEKLKLKGSSGFAIYELNANVENSLNPNERVAEVLMKWQIKGVARTGQLLFRKGFLRHPSYNLKRKWKKIFYDFKQFLISKRTNSLLETNKLSTSQLSCVKVLSETMIPLILIQPPTMQILSQDTSLKDILVSRESLILSKNDIKVLVHCQPLKQSP